MKKIVSRNDFIVDLCRDKNIIDIACVCHDLSEYQIKKGIWLHENIKKVAKSLIGYDIETEEIKRLQKLGYNIRYCNAEFIGRFARDKYDVVVLGSCIEHFFNPGMVLDSIKSLCHPDTKIVLSTVNVWAIRYFISAWIGRESRTCRNDHVSWYSHYVLENLLRMKGYEVIDQRYYNNYTRINGIRPFFRYLQKWLMPFTSHGIIVVFKTA